MWVQRKTWVDSCISSYLIVARRSVWGQGENNSKASPCIWGALWLQEGCRWQPPDEGRSDPRGPGLSVGWIFLYVWISFWQAGWYDFDKCYFVRAPGSPGQQHTKALQIIPPCSNLKGKVICFCYCLSNPNNQRWLESKRLISSRFIMMHVFHFLS